MITVEAKRLSAPVSMLIDGVWCRGGNGEQQLLDPATEAPIGTVALASKEDLNRACSAALRGFALWREVSAFERARILRKAGELLRQRVESIAAALTLEQGKPLAEARVEVLAGADIIDWFAEEARRTYGRIVPARALGVEQLVVKEPVGPVAAFTPWNFPINQAVRKLGGSLAAGCSIILKGPEETPASCAELVRAFHDAGVPAGVANLVFGNPAEVSQFLIAHPAIRKITFTGSTAVGKQLAMLAGQHMKRITMELGGHAPVLIFEDADVELAVRVLSASKHRNAGQACISPSRYLVHQTVYARFVDAYCAAATQIRVGDGFDPQTQMGPLANPRRQQAMRTLTADAVERGAKLQCGGRSAAKQGYFFEPTVLTSVPHDARVMNEEPFGPISTIVPFTDVDEAIVEANRLPYGLAAYAYTSSLDTAMRVGAALESGMVAINHHGLALPEIPFGGVKDSGYGSEGGSEAIEAYLNTKLVTRRAVRV